MDDENRPIQMDDDEYYNDDEYYDDDDEYYDDDDYEYYDDAEYYPYYEETEAPVLSIRQRISISLKYTIPVLFRRLSKRINGTGASDLDDIPF